MISSSTVENDFPRRIPASIAPCSSMSLVIEHLIPCPRLQPHCGSDASISVTRTLAGSPRRVKAPGEKAHRGCGFRSQPGAAHKQAGGGGATHLCSRQRRYRVGFKGG